MCQGNLGKEWKRRRDVGKVRRIWVELRWRIERKLIGVRFRGERQ